MQGLFSIRPRWLVALLLLAVMPAQAYWFEYASFISDPSPPGGASVRMGDVTGDGRVDVVVAMNTATPGIFVYPGLANGQLGAPRRIHQLPCHSVLLLDIDRDGLLDIVGEQGGIVLYRANGHGGFEDYGTGDPIPGPSSSLVNFLIAYDVDEDGRPEIIGLHWYGSAQVFYLGGNGRVASSRSFPVPTEGYNDMAVGDVDHDGKLDLVVTSGQGQDTHLQVLGPDGSGGLEVRATFAATYGAFAGVAIGDFDHDGLEEVVVSRPYNLPDGELWVILFDEALDIVAVEPLAIENGVPSALETADLNGDGLDDLALFHNGGWGWGYYLQRQDGGLYPEAMVTVGHYITGWRSEMLAAGDLDGDGCGDMVVSEVNYAMTVMRGSDCAHKLPAADLEIHARTYLGINPDVEWPFGNSNALEIKYRVRRGDLAVDDAHIRVTFNLRPGYHSTAVAFYNNMYTDRQLCTKVAEKPSTLIYDCVPYRSSGMEYWAPDLWQVMAFYFDLRQAMVADVEIQAYSPSHSDPNPSDNTRKLLYRYLPAYAAPAPVDSPLARDGWTSAYGLVSVPQAPWFAHRDLLPSRASASQSPGQDMLTPAARRALIDRRGQPARRRNAMGGLTHARDAQLVRTDR